MSGRDPWWTKRAARLARETGCKVSYLEHEAHYPDFGGLMTSDGVMWRHTRDLDDLEMVPNSARRQYSIAEVSADPPSGAPAAGGG